MRQEQRMMHASWPERQLAIPKNLSILYSGQFLPIRQNKIPINHYIGVIQSSPRFIEIHHVLIPLMGGLTINYFHLYEGNRLGSKRKYQKKWENPFEELERILVVWYPLPTEKLFGFPGPRPLLNYTSVCMGFKSKCTGHAPMCA